MNGSLDDLLEAYLSRRLSGLAESEEEFLAAHPQHEEALRRRLKLLSGVGIDALRKGASDHDAAAIPHRFDDYRILGVVGQGGMGIVYEAEQISLKRRVAIKVLRAFGATSDRLRERFEREIAALARIKHPNVVRVFGSGTVGGLRYVVMDFVEGAALDSLVSPNFGVTSPDSVSDHIRVAAKVGAALDHVHELGIIHRDVKPSNIRLDARGEPVLVDFGLARDDSMATLTLSGEFLGTMGFSAPEQALGRPHDRRVDVFGLGATLQYLLTGSPPFPAESLSDLVRKLTTGQRVPLRRDNPALSRDLATVVEHATAIEPPDRYGSCRDFADDLNALLENRPIRARSLGIFTRFRRWCTRNPALASAAALAAFFLIAGLVTALVLLAKTDVERRRATSALEQYELLADLRRLQELHDEADRFVISPASLPGMEDWLQRADELISRLDDHVKALEMLRKTARPPTLAEEEEDAASDDRTEQRRILNDQASLLKKHEDALAALGQREPKTLETLDEVAALEQAISEGRRFLGQYQQLLDGRLKWRFESPLDQFRHDQVEVLVSRLTDFADPRCYGQTRARVRRWLDQAAALEGDSVEAHRDRWTEAIAAVADQSKSRHYRGLPITPITGLVPLGADPISGLQEFCHALSGAIPRRDSTTGELILADNFGVVLVLIPGDEFEMGPDREDTETAPVPHTHRAHNVALDPFLVSKYELTRAQWMAVDGQDPSYSPIGIVTGDKRLVTKRHPVDFVSWPECRRMLGWMGLKFPTEAQWEYACRAGTGTRWSTGASEASLAGFANLADELTFKDLAESLPFEHGFRDGFRATAPVGSFRPNPFGLHDMHGNVSEWCADLWSPYSAPALPGDGLREIGRSGLRVARGGSYLSTAREVRSRKRFPLDPRSPQAHIGARPALSLSR